MRLLRLGLLWLSMPIGRVLHWWCEDRWRHSDPRGVNGRDYWQNYCD